MKKSLLFYHYITITMVISLVSWNIVENEYGVGICFNYSRESTVPGLTFPRKHEHRIRLVKDRQPIFTLYVVYISHLEDKFFKNLKKTKESLRDKLFKACDEY